MSEHTRELTLATFTDAVERSHLPLVVDFWAPWCSPCLAMAPVIDELAEEFAGRATVAKLDIEAHPDAATQFNVGQIPTLLFFRDGAEVDRVVGLVGRKELSQKLMPWVPAAT